MRAPFDFQTQLRVGHLGEAFILGAHPELVQEVEDRRWDLTDPTQCIRTPDGAGRPARIEVKTDSYPLGDTPNLFMERRTLVARGSANTTSARTRMLSGGPWRALRDGVDELVYLYSNGGTKDEPGDPVAYWFRDIPALVAELDALILLRPRVVFPRRVRNEKVSAQGYLVPRERLLRNLPGVELIRYEKEAV